MSDEQDNFDICAVECKLNDTSMDTDAGKTFTHKEHSIWLDMFCPELTCLEKTGTDLI
jgi:hypothetical protein